MNALNSAQQAAVRSFCEVSGVSEAQSILCLAKHGYNLDNATNAFFDRGLAGMGVKVLPASGPTPEERTKLRNVDFNKYFLLTDPGCARQGPEDNENDALEGFEVDTKLGQDIGVDLFTEPVAFVIFQRFEFTLGRITRKGFLAALQALNLNTWAEVRGKLQEFKGELTARGTFKPIWDWSYKACLNVGEAVMAAEDLRDLHEKLLVTLKWPLASKWCKFITSGYLKKAITQDAHNCLFNFTAAVTKTAHFPPDLEDCDFHTSLVSFMEWVQKGEPCAAAGGGGGGSGGGGGGKK